MGYYVNTGFVRFHVKHENFDEAYRALCALNADDTHKSGGRVGGPPTLKEKNSKSVARHPDKWFAWMPWNYDEICRNLDDILETLGFETEIDDAGDICGLAYNNKTGNEDLFLKTLAPWVEDGSIIVWNGEDGDIWADVFEDGELEVIYADEVSRIIVEHVMNRKGTHDGV